jgi:uncharacterized protein YoxC
MRTLLIVLTLVELAILAVVLAVYLIAIAARLRKISHTLGLVNFGVRAIEKQTEPIGPVAADINGALEGVADALEEVTGKKPVPQDKTPAGS